MYPGACAFFIIGLSVALFFYSPTSAGAGATHERSIEGPLANPQAVTRKCLECHKSSADELMSTSHWLWLAKQEVPERGKIEHGKRGAINNFMIAINSNWPSCTSCHPGYGWKGADFNFDERLLIDCLICHDSTGTYIKDPDGAGMPVGFTGGKGGGMAADLLSIARKAGKPTRKNCGICHFSCGGDDNIKHGDLDSSLIEPSKNYDVHMGVDNLDFSCQFCHKAAKHNIMGNSMGVSPGGPSRVQCAECHTKTPHKQPKINDHVNTVSCQACHIPTYANSNPTQMSWDWSTAGQDITEEPDKFGKPTYDKTKGSFKWRKTVWPQYAWFNGKAGFYKPGDVINPGQPVKLTWPLGDYTDKKAMIFPFKVHTGKQIYDKKSNYLIIPKLVGPDGYMATFDWDKAAKVGMASVNLPYSGQYGFVETEMYYRINHMVVPKNRALKCANCHQKKGRLEWAALGYQDMGDSAYPPNPRSPQGQQDEPPKKAGR